MKGGTTAMTQGETKHPSRFSFLHTRPGRIAASLAVPTTVLLIVVLLAAGLLPLGFNTAKDEPGSNRLAAPTRYLLLLRQERAATGVPINNLWMLRTDGTALMRVTNEPTGVDDYAVSPDGAQIVYVTANGPSASSLWLIDRDGTRRVRLSPADAPARYASPAWSPAGDVILFTQYLLAAPRTPGNWAPGDAGIPLVSEAGKIWAITPAGKIVGRIYGNGDESGGASLWSPDASHAAFLEVFAQTGKTNVVVTDFSASPVKFTVDTTLHVNWSPDSQWLAYDESIGNHAGRSQIILRRCDGSARTPLFTESTPSSDSAPVWSPNGQTLAFVRRPLSLLPPGATGAATEIWRANRDGRASQRIVGGDGRASTDLRWSADGQQLSATRYAVQGKTQSGVWLMNADGTGARLLLDAATHAVWLP